MLSFSEMQTQFQDLTQDYSDEALVFAKRNINIGQNELETDLESFQTEELTPTISSIAGTSTYKTPASFIRLKEAFITIDDVEYPITPVFEEAYWRRLKQNRDTVRSDILTHLIVRRDRFEVFPTPATSSKLITFIYEAGGKQLVADDYTAGFITTLANAGTAVTATGTTFTTAMAGRYLRIENDGQWYKIASFGSTTSLVLDKPYEGLSISGGSESYTLGQMPRTPGSTHIIPVYYAVMMYYSGFKQNTEKNEEFEGKYEKALFKAKATYGRRYSQKYIPGRRARRQSVNPNYPPRNMA